MGYLEINSEKNEFYKERLELVTERLSEIASENALEGALGDCFKEIAAYLLVQKEIFDKAVAGEIATMSEAIGKSYNEKLYDQFRVENYGTSYANPAYAVEKLGEKNGQMLASFFYRIAGRNSEVFEGNPEFLCIYCELIVEIYNLYEDNASEKEIREAGYSFVHDYSEVITEDNVRHLLCPEYDYLLDLVMNQDISDEAFLYRYGYPISEDIVASLKYLNTLPEADIQAMADTFTEGYRIGFATCNKDISKKSVAEIRYPLGFERMVRAAVKNFEKIGLKSILVPSPKHRTMEAINKQADFDHKEDSGLWMDKGYVEYYTTCYRNALEDVKEIAPNYGGPAVIEVWGETPFVPANKEEAIKLSADQQQLSVRLMSECGQLINKYIHGEERSFTIISYPVPAIGEKFEEIFAETVKLNTLDYMLYRNMQQKMIDVLDTADKVHIVGTNGNKTDLYVKVWDLADPAKETAFENCVADVNIPVGEVFTSPVLEGTNGKLHVSQVYLNELNYLNLEIDFKEGMIENYTCTNFASEEENKKYVFDNVLFHHDTLALGEFAIGTNTTAYKMARVYDIADKLPILIAEKTGPHFAVGDTCFTYDEDNETFNPDGKKIVARDNSVSIQRKTDISKAYFNCHTDITIPYDELGAITVIRKDGSEVDIIRDGRFVLPGVEKLNEPLDELLKFGK